MKLLRDECVVQEFRLLIPDHSVFTVGFLGWSGTTNGNLLRQAAVSGFDALITTDRGYAHQHDIEDLPLSLVILHSRSNDLEDLLPLVPHLLNALAALSERSLIEIRTPG